MKMHHPPRTALFIVFFLLLTVPLSAQTTDDNPLTYEIERFSDTFVRIGTTSSPWYSIYVSYGEDGVLIVDTGFQQVVPLFKEALAELTDQPVKIVILTHSHPDHTGGLGTLGPDALVIVSEKGIMSNYFALDPLRQFTNPTFGVSDQATLHFNGEDINFIPLPQGHSGDEMLIHFAGANVICVGSRILPKAFPFLDNPVQSDLDEYFYRIEWMVAEYPDARFATGHGPVMTAEEVLDYKAFSMKTTDQIAEALRAGEPPDSVVAHGYAKVWGGADQRAATKLFWVNQVARIKGVVEAPKTSIAQPMSEELMRKDIKASIKLYKKLKKKEADNWNFAEAQVNLFGYQLMYRNRLDDAAEIFKLNIEEHPESANVYDSYGESLLAKGDTTAAIKQYEKALEVNPDFVNASTVLKLIRP